MHGETVKNTYTVCK